LGASGPVLGSPDFGLAFCDVCPREGGGGEEMARVVGGECEGGHGGVWACTGVRVGEGERRRGEERVSVDA
jgi:hypothetical protein